MVPSTSCSLFLSRLYAPKSWRGQAVRRESIAVKSSVGRSVRSGVSVRNRWDPPINTIQGRVIYKEGPQRLMWSILVAAELLPLLDPRD